MKTESKDRQPGRIVRSKEDTGNSLQFPVIGKIKIGEKSDSGYPKSLDYFRATGNYTSKFNEAYPKQPKKIQIIFVSDDNNKSCLEEWQGRDNAGRLAGTGDGETYHLWNGKEYEATTDKEKITNYTRDKKIKWSVVLTLNFLIPKISGVLGLWRFQTKGVKSSVISIRETFDTMQKNVGTVVNIPFDLVVEKHKSQKPDNKNFFPVVNLIPNMSQENMTLLANYLQSGSTDNLLKIGMLTGEKIKQLNAPKTDQKEAK